MGSRSGWQGGRFGQSEFVQRLQHGLALPPRHLRAARGDVVAVLGGHGNETFRLHAHRFEEGAEFRLNLVETRLGIIFQVHLVDQHGNLPDAEEIEQVAVAPRLFLHAFVGVDEQQGGLGVGRAGDHVLEKFLVAGRVNEAMHTPSVRDKLTAFGAEIVSDQDSTPQHLGELVKSEIAKWAAPIKAAGVSVE